MASETSIEGGGATGRRRQIQRLQLLKNERTTWDEHWRELADHMAPRRFRYLSTERNKGTKRNEKIINGTPLRARRVLSSGMMAGITSPARPWYRLTLPDADLAEHGPVKEWLHDTAERIREVFARSNVYNALAQLYPDFSVFGTSPMLVDEDDEDALRAYVLPVGQYCLANSPRQMVDTVFREFGMTVSQLVRTFGIAKCSDKVKRLFESGKYDEWCDVVHVIEPRAKGDRSEYGAGAKDMPWKSCWFEPSQPAGESEYLRESGYEEFPVMAPRWDLVGEDVYGTSPGMDALGDCKALQLYEERKAQGLSLLITPPMRAPSTLMGRRTSLLPADVTFVDAMQPGQTYEPAHVPDARVVQFAGMEIRELERRINGAFMADLWLMLAEAGPKSPDMTAREVAERHEEKMLQLGPVLERLSDELLDPLIDRAFAVLLRRGELPEAPPELEGQQLKVEYISIMAQAQKMIGIGAVERLSQYVIGVANNGRPEILDKVDFDQSVDDYGEMLGVNPKLIVPDDKVAAMRQARAKAQQQQEQAMQAEQAAKSAQALSGASLEGDNALSRLVSGVAAASSGAGGGAGGAQ